MTTYDVGSGCSIELSEYPPGTGSVVILAFHTPNDSIRFSLTEDVLRALGEELTDRAESARLERNPHVVEKVREALFTDPADDVEVEVEVDPDAPDPALLKEWTSTPDCDGDYLTMEFAVGYTGPDYIGPDVSTYIDVRGGAAFLTAEDAQRVIDRLQAHIVAHRNRTSHIEKRELERTRNEWAAALFPGIGPYEELLWTQKKVVDRAIENHNALIGKDD